MATMPIRTTDTATAWSPDITEFAAADVIPTALILECSTQGGTVNGDAPSVRVGYLDDDEAQFTAEGAAIPEAEPTLAEKVIHTAKVTQLIRISQEQYDQDGTGEQLATSVARAIARRANQAFVAEAAPVTPAVAPVAGLLYIAGLIDGGALDTNLDGLVDILAELQGNRSNPSHILLGVNAWREVRKWKQGTAAGNMPLLGAGADDITPRLLSLPVIVDVALPSDAGLVLDRSAIVSAVGPIRVATSEHQYFNSESVALRASWRFGHTVVRPERCAKFTIADAGAGG